MYRGVCWFVMRSRLLGYASIKKGGVIISLRQVVTVRPGCMIRYGEIGRGGVSDKISLFKRTIKPPLISLRTF